MSMPLPSKGRVPHRVPSRPSRKNRLIALFLALVVGVGAVAMPAGSALAASASKETLQKLSDAEAQLDAVQKQLDQISADYQALAKEQTETLQEIEVVQAKIAEVEAQIEKRQEELREKQDALAERVAATYKAGNDNLLALVLSSSSFEELTSNIYYANKVTESNVALIDDVREVKRALEEDRLELKNQEAELEALKEEQQARMDEMQAKQEEAEATVSNLSQEVRDLMDKRDAELAASIAAEAAQRRAQEEAAAANPAPSGGGGSSSGSSSSPDYNYGGGTSDNYTSKGSAIVAAASTVPSPGYGLCAMWVSQVYQAALGYYPGGNANNMYARCTTSNKANLEPGMIVAVSTHPHSQAGSIYGHVGIYVGNGLVMDNIGYIRTIGLDDWISYYDDTVPVRFGWL